jgi:uridine kinase
MSPFYSSATHLRYSPPWADLSIIGIAGSSGSGKTSVAMEIVRSLNLPWVVILVMVAIVDGTPWLLIPGPNIGAIQDSFYKTLTPDQHAKAHSNEYDFDCPDALDFDALVHTLRDLKKGYIRLS